MANESLGKAKEAKNDEFYTQYVDIEREMNAYLEYDPDVFRGKTILLPCDDPEWSNFTRYFAQNFGKFGLKKLISTSFAPNSKHREIPYEPTLFEMESPEFDESKSESHGKIFTLTRDTTGDETINFDDLEWTYLEGDGDFRSEEVSALRDEADIVVTNPPFSLFTEFVSWVFEGNKDFAIIGNMNAATNRTIFPLLQAGKMWLGASRFGVGQMYFYVFDSAPVKTGQILVDGQKMQTIGSTAWFTSLDHGKRHSPLTLMTTADNKKFSKVASVRGAGYLEYDNYKAIEIPRVEAIPSDYQGLMGVPITFLGKHNPDQFEIVGISANDGIDAGFRKPGQARYDRPYLNGNRMYVRLFIRAKADKI